MKYGSIGTITILLAMMQNNVMAENTEVEQIRKAAESLMKSGIDSKTPPQTEQSNDARDKVGKSDQAATKQETASSDKPGKAANEPAPATLSVHKPDKAPPHHVESQVIISKDKDGKQIREVKIAEGDSLSAIAERLYGSKDHYLLIFEANRERLGLESPDHIRTGLRLLIPESPAPEPATVSAPPDQATDQQPPPVVPPSAVRKPPQE